MELNKIYLGNAYELIKKIPDHSVDLIYTDIPYLIEHHGSCGSSALGKRMDKRDDELKGRINDIQKKIDDLKAKMDNAKDKNEYEKWHAQRGNLLNRLNLLTNQDITKGIDYSILDEFVRVCKDIYIYMVFQRANLRLATILCRKTPLPIQFACMVQDKWCASNKQYLVAKPRTLFSF